MLYTAIGLIVLGLVLLFIVPMVGIPVGILGLVLVVAYLVGASRRATSPQP